MNLHSIYNNQAFASEKVAPEQKQPQRNTTEVPFWGKDGFTFGDVLDMVNPLHHIPVVSRLYQQYTNDGVCQGSKIVGGALLGGLVGGVTGVLTSLANSAVRNETEHDMLEHLVEMADNHTEIYETDELDQLAWLQQSSNKSSSPVIAKEKYDNPFFSHLFEADAIESDYGVSSVSDSANRIRDWGKV